MRVLPLLVVVLAWAGSIAVELFHLPNTFLLALVVPPFELALWLLAVRGGRRTCPLTAM